MFLQTLLQHDSVYSVVYNQGSGNNRFFIMSHKKDKSNNDVYNLFYIRPNKADYTYSVDKDNNRLPKQKQSPFITKKVYKQIINKINDAFSKDVNIKQLFNETNAFSIEDINKSFGEKEGEQQSMNELDMKLFMNQVLEQQKEMLKNIKVDNPYEDAIVQAIIDKGKNISTDNLVETAKEKLDSFIKQNYGPLPKKIEVNVPSISSKQMEGIFHNKFEHILKLVTANIPTLLIGPAGSGKNHTLEQVSEALDLDFYFSNAITQEFKLTGFIDANGLYHETQFYKAFKNGGLFFLDEIDASIPEVLIILNSAIANKYFDFPTGRVKAHEDFRVVAAGNTMGTGADALYVGRSQLDAATIDRFAQVEFNYDSEVEEQLASNTDLYDFIKSARKALTNNSMQYTVSMRSIINASKIDGVVEDTFAVKGIILKTIPIDELRMIVDDLPYNNRYTKATLELIGQG